MKQSKDVLLKLKPYVPMNHQGPYENADSVLLGQGWNLGVCISD